MFLKFAISLALLAPQISAQPVPAASGLTVHEWGTFTSIAAADGRAEPWVSLTPPADLPCFVYHLSAQCIKCMPNRVRMETPVLYFYAAQPMSASVHVDLPRGLITEWYPKATQTNGLAAGLTYGTGGNIEWPNVRVLPGVPEEFPEAGDHSHYYAARATDSAPLLVENQPEKVLFYRGIADFEIPLLAKFTPDRKLELGASSTEPIGFAILYENRNGRVGYRVIQDVRGQIVVETPDLTDSAESARTQLASALVANGLYAKEAAAMIETWRDSWFEEGMRIFYIMPRKEVDTVLPIRVSPAPSALVRVFVGRIELLSPEMEKTLETALAGDDTGTLARLGRFAQPFCDRILQGPSKIRISQAASRFLGQAAMAPPVSASPCAASGAVLPTEQR